MNVAEAVGRALAGWGVEAVFGLMGSGNLTFTNALRDGGAKVYGARHEGGATSMADGYARVSGKVGVVSVHQGPGLTNTITALTEAAKSRTPLLVLAPDVPAAALRSNFRIDQQALAESVGAVVERVHEPATALSDAARAYARARNEQRAVVLMLPLDIQGMECEQDVADVPLPEALLPPTPAADVIAHVAELLAEAQRPAIVAGRGAVRAGAGDDLRALGERTGAILATSAVANGLFAGDPYSVGIAGGFSSACGAEMLRACDLILGFGATLNQWTTRHGTLIGPGARVVQVDLEPDGIGGHRRADVGVVGDARAAARALLAAVGDGLDGEPRWRTPEVAERIAMGRMRDEPYEESSAAGLIDPRTLTIALDDLLPADRAVVVDSGHFLGYPSQYLSVADAPGGFVFPNAFQCVGLGLSTGIGAALGAPGRLTVAAVGDGGLLMALPELETLGRLGLPMLVLVYNDAAYGAEVHHFRSLRQEVDLAQFPPTDIAALALAAGCAGVTVREVADLEAVASWLERRDGPLLVDAKVDPTICAEWLEEAFRAH